MKKTRISMAGLLGLVAIAGAVTGGFWLKKKKNRIFAKFLKCYRKEKTIKNN